MQLEELAKLVRTRRSVRVWQDKEVPDEPILRALEIGSWAPNGGNRQVWKFLVVKNRDLISQMGDAVQAKSELLASWPEAGEHAEHAERWQRTAVFFRYAPVCIAVLVGKYESVQDIILSRRGKDDPEAVTMMDARRTASSRLQSVAAAISYTLLALHHQGLSACWMAGPVQAKGDIEKLLDVPSDMEFVALIPLGYAAEEPEPKGRKPVTEFVKFYR